MHSTRSRRRRAVASAVAGAAMVACSDATGPTDVDCAVTPNPAIPLLSGLASTTRVSLGPGESCAVRAESGGSLRIAPAAGPATYLIAVQSASRVPAARASLSVKIDGAGATASRLPDEPLNIPFAGTGALVEGADLELRLRRNIRRELVRRRARPARPARPGELTHLSLSADLPVVGDTIVLRNSVDVNLDVDCSSTDSTPAVVRSVGEHLAVLEDLEVAGGLTDEQHLQIIASLDDPVFRISEAYFGSPADLDGNQRVLVLITPDVNRATPRGSPTFIAGFFNPSDLSDPATCPASNTGEVLYMLAPDPDGVFGDAVDADFAASNAVSVSAHELTHLLAAQQRVTLTGGTFADLDDSWLDEGLAHTAEMVVGLAEAGLTPGSNHDFEALTADPEVFNTFHLSNFRRAGYYLLRPASTLALGDEGGADPGGLNSLEMRGFAWLLLRWIADQSDLEAGGILGGPAEEAIFRELASGGPTRATGIENVERVAAARLGSSNWRDLVARYALTPLADDAEGSPTVETQVTSLHLPDIFAGIHSAIPDRDPFRRPYPLVPETISGGSGGTSLDFDLFSSASAYIVVTTGGGEPVDVRLTTASGGLISSAVLPQIVIQRTK